MNRKAVSTIVAAIMIVTISIGLAGTALIWGGPLIKKRSEASVTDRIYNQFLQTNQNSLPKIIEDVANNRGTQSFTAGGDGIWILDPAEDSLEFTFTSKTANIATNTLTPVSITPGVQCTGTTPLHSPVPVTGILGPDSASVVCVSAVAEADFFTIKYKIWFRELNDNPANPTQGFKIDLEQDPTGLARSTSKTVKITFEDSTEQMVGSENLITKKIKILLI